MEDLMQFHYNTVMFMGIVMGVLALTTFFIHSEALKNNDSLNRSRYNLAWGFVVLCIDCVLHGVYGFRFNDPSVGVALDITCYYLLIIFFSFSYLPLLDPTYRTSSRRTRFLLKWLACSGLVWSAALFVDGTPSMIMQICGGVLFVVSVVDVTIAYSRRYHNVSSMLTETSVANVENFSRFLYSSLMLIIILGVFAATVSILHDMQVQCYFNLISTFLFWRLFMSFNNYVCNLNN